VPPAQIQRVVEQGLIVGADIEHDRERRRRVDAGAQPVQRKLANRNPHTADSEVAEAQNPFAIRDHDHLAMRARCIAQDRVDVVDVRI
jgi:hypothetical protein